MWWVLGFSYEQVVDAWQDARLATALETLWNAASKPDDADAWFMASADEFAFRWWLNDGAAALLDGGAIHWRSFVVGRVPGVPSAARPFLRPAPTK